MHQANSKPALALLNGTDSVAAYLEAIKGSKKLTLPEESVLAKRIRGGDKRALRKLLEANLKFVVSVCRNYEHQGMPLADLISEGNLGLIEAARRFDETRNFRFISYAVWWIRQSILSALSKQSRTVCITQSTSATMSRIGKAAQRLTQKLGRQPSPEELELETGLRSERIKECLDLDERLISLNRPAPGVPDALLLETMADVSESRTKRILEISEASVVVEALMRRLDDREGKVLKLYFGIGDENPLSLGDISERFSMSRENVRQIKKKAIAKLKRAHKSEWSPNSERNGTP
jgi:RNA polymerase primary sigma factor